MGNHNDDDDRLTINLTIVSRILRQAVTGAVVAVAVAIARNVPANVIVFAQVARVSPWARARPVVRNASSSVLADEVPISAGVVVALAKGPVVSRQARASPVVRVARTVVLAVDIPRAAGVVVLAEISRISRINPAIARFVSGVAGGVVLAVDFPRAAGVVVFAEVSRIPVVGTNANSVGVVAITGNAGDVVAQVHHVAGQSGVARVAVAGTGDATAASIASRVLAVVTEDPREPWQAVASSVGAVAGVTAGHVEAVVKLRAEVARVAVVTATGPAVAISAAIAADAITRVVVVAALTRITWGAVASTVATSAAVATIHAVAQVLNIALRS